MRILRQIGRLGNKSTRSCGFPRKVAHLCKNPRNREDLSARDHGLPLPRPKAHAYPLDAVQNNRGPSLNVLQETSGTRFFSIPNDSLDPSGLETAARIGDSCIVVWQTLRRQAATSAAESGFLPEYRDSCGASRSSVASADASDSEFRRHDSACRWRVRDLSGSDPPAPYEI